MALSNLSIEAYSIVVLDIAGRVIYEQYGMNQESFTIDLSNTSDGTYMLQLASDNVLTTKRIVLKK